MHGCQASSGFVLLNRKYVHNLVYRVLYSSALIVLTYPIALSSQSKEKLETFETWAAKAAAAREAGHTAEAIEAYQHTVALRPGWEEGWWYLGTLNYDNEHFAEANKALRKVVELDPRLGPAWAFLGLGEFETQDYKASFNHLQRARGLGFAENPEVSKVALYHLGLLFNLNGEFEKSTELLVTQFGTSVFPEQIKTAMGMALLRVPLLPDHVDPAKDALVHAAGETAALLANHKTDDAFASFEQVLAQYPDTPYVHYAYGMALALASRDKDAESQLNQESKITKTRALPWIGLATVFLRQERGKDAEAAARHAVQLEPKSPASYDVLSRALQLMGKSDEAETARTKAKNLVSTPVLPDIVQAKRYELGSTQDIFSTMASSAAARPKGLNDNFDDLARRAESARSAGNIVAATQLYEAALQLHPEWGEGWRSVRTFAYMNGRFAEAITDLRRSVTLDTRQAKA